MKKTEKILWAVFIIGACLYCACLFYGMYQIDSDYNYDFEEPQFTTYPHISTDDGYRSIIICGILGNNSCQKGSWEIAPDGTFKTYGYSNWNIRNSTEGR